MDEEHQRIENYIKYQGRFLDRARECHYEHEIEFYFRNIEEASNQLLERELQLQEEYKRKEKAHG